MCSPLPNASPLKRRTPHPRVRQQEGVVRGCGGGLREETRKGLGNAVSFSASKDTSKMSLAPAVRRRDRQRRRRRKEAVSAAAVLCGPAMGSAVYALLPDCFAARSFGRSSLWCPFGIHSEL